MVVVCVCVSVCMCVCLLNTVSQKMVHLFVLFRLFLSVGAIFNISQAAGLLLRSACAHLLCSASSLLTAVQKRQQQSCVHQYTTRKNSSIFYLYQVSHEEEVVTFGPSSIVKLPSPK